MRNATVTTIAPTGSLHLIADTSSGIEPLFSLASTRRMGEWSLPLFHPPLKKYLQSFSSGTDILAQVKRRPLASSPVPETVKESV